MSHSISVISVSLVLVSLMLVSCSQKKNEAAYSVFERSFCAQVTVKNADGEYRASVTLKGIQTFDTTNTDDNSSEGVAGVRDGNIVYTYPDSVTGISAVRRGSTVTVNVSGIDVVPSENIAAKYTFLLDLLDLRSDEVCSESTAEIEGVAAVLLTYKYGEQELVVAIDRVSKKPMYLSYGDTTVSFDSFIYI